MTDQKKKIKTFAVGLSEEEDDFIKQIKGGMSNSEFLREVLKTSPMVQNHANRLGKDVNMIFRAKKYGGKRQGSGNPNWKKKTEQNS